MDNCQKGVSLFLADLLLGLLTSKFGAGLVLPQHFLRVAHSPALIVQCLILALRESGGLVIHEELLRD